MTFLSNVQPSRRILPTVKRQPWTCKCGVVQHPGIKRAYCCLAVRP